MKESLSAGDLLWQERQRVIIAQTRRERLAWVKNFALVLALIVVTVAAALVFASMGV